MRYVKEGGIWKIAGLQWFQTLYVPVRPGFWQAYQTGLPQTRGN